MRYSLKNLCSMFTKQRLLALLLVLNIVVSCLVICFSYGLYQNYNVILSESEQNEYKRLEIMTDDNNIYEGYHGMHISRINVSEVKRFMRGLSPDTAVYLKSLDCTVTLSNDLYLTEQGNSTFMSFEFEMAVKDGEIIPSERMQQVLTYEDYTSEKHIAAISQKRYDPDQVNTMENWYPDGTVISSQTRLLEESDKYLNIGGKEYEIRVLPSSLDKPSQYNYSEKEIDISSSVFIPFTSLKDDLELSMISPKSSMILNFSKSLTKQQYNDISRALSDSMKDKAFLPQLEFTEVTELYYYRTVLIISVVIAVLTAVNMAILYRYILEKRSRELAVFRMFGCSKYQSVLMYLTECMLVNIPFFVLTELVFHKLILPRLCGIFEHIEEAYSTKIYLWIFLIYLFASLAVMLIMIVTVISKNSLTELKTQKTASRFEIMKIFEITQLGAVLTLLVMICSAISSRYSLYEPFHNILESEGYMAYTVGSGSVTPKELMDALPDAEILFTCIGGYYIEETDKQIDTITYCDELAECYKPELSEGIWLSESSDSYLSTGYMPAVVDLKCEYKVGETVIIPDYENAWDKNGKPVSKADVKIKIIGRLKDDVSLVSYPDYINAPVDYRNIYGTLHSDYEDNDFMLMRMSDMYSFTGRYTPIIGNQFIFCSSENFKSYKQALEGIGGLSVASFEQLNKASRKYIFEQLTTLFPIALCIFILTVISSISISAIYTKRHLHAYAVLYICGATWKSCALRSLRAGLITCGVSAALTAAVLGIGKLTFMKDTVVTFGLIPLAVCAGVLVLYVALSMIMPLLIIGKTEPRAVLKEE